MTEHWKKTRTTVADESTGWYPTTQWLWQLSDGSGLRYMPCTAEENMAEARRERRAAEVARIDLHASILKDSMYRQRAALQSIVGIYEEQAARKQYDILGDGSV